MTADRFATLSEDQRTCLRLVAQGYSSKEIARPLGLHPRTIDQRLDRAKRLLGEPDRVTAARALTRHEAGAAAYDVVIYDPRPLAPPRFPDEEADGPVDRVRETTARFVHFPEHRSSVLPFLSSFQGPSPDALRPLERLAYILRLSVLVPMALGALSLGLALLLKLLWGLGFA